MNEHERKIMYAVIDSYMPTAEPPTFFYASAEDMKGLQALGYVEGNGAMAREDGLIPWRPTDAGRSAFGSPADVPPEKAEPDAQPEVADESNKANSGIVTMALPARTRKSGQRKLKYDFEKLEVGQAFFVPLDKPEPAKSFSSNIISAKKRLDGRNFAARTIEDGKDFGEEYAGVRGVGVFRTE